MQKTAIRRDNLNMMRPVTEEKSNPAKKFLDELLQSGVIAHEDWDSLEVKNRLELEHHANLDRLLMRLVDYKLLTQYQAARLQGRQTSGLLLGNYRLRERLGAGGASVIFKAEHLQTRQVVALKVLIPAPGQDSPLLRFDTERRSISQLQHPHIVQALEAGEANNPDPDAPVLYFYAMEYVSGLDLEAHVRAHGPLDIVQAATVALQIADALDCAHAHNFVHRDVKPSNIFWTEGGQAKLFDFGLMLSQSRRQTQQGTILGMLEFIAPEQAKDSSAVDIRADIYALGATIFYCLTGQPPFQIKPKSDVLQAVLDKINQPPPSIRALRKDVPESFAAIMERMMANDPKDRFATPGELMQALGSWQTPQGELLSDSAIKRKNAAAANFTGPHILLAMPESPDRRLIQGALAPLGGWCETEDELGDANGFSQNLVILAADQSSLPETLQRLRRTGRANLKVLLLARFDTTLDVSQLLTLGVDDVLQLPLQPAQILVRVKGVLQLQEAQDRLTQLSEGAIPPPAGSPAPGKEQAAKPGWIQRILQRKRAEVTEVVRLQPLAEAVNLHLARAVNSFRMSN